MAIKIWHKLSNDMGATFDDHGGIVLLDTRAYRPKRITVITEEETVALVKLFTDGCCPVCLEEIAPSDVVCDDCFEAAKAVRR